MRTSDFFAVDREVRVRDENLYGMTISDRDGV